MVNCPVIDADGHVLEKARYIRKYLEAPWDKRSTALRLRSKIARKAIGLLETKAS